MAIEMVLFTCVGPDPDILILDSVLKKPLYGKPRTLPSENHYGAMVAVHEASHEESDGVRFLYDWLVEAEDILAELKGKKIVEFQCCLGLNDCSRFISFPVEVLQICSDLEIQLTVQYLKEMPLH